MVARRDEHRHREGAQTAQQLLASLVIAARAVEQIAAEEHEIDLLLPRKAHERGEKLPLLGAADRGLARGQRLKGRIQMQIRRV